MSKISNDGLQQIQVIKNALDSMYDKLNQTVYVPRKKASKNIDGDYDRVNLFQNVNEEFEAISEIVSSVSDWKKVK
tara:strand:+ start:69 stop:296 length:228 start_codon:yes stop_codon:yes gene_type:complete